MGSSVKPRSHSPESDVRMAMGYTVMDQMYMAMGYSVRSRSVSHESKLRVAMI